ncbi:mycothiol synthase [Corynebacterium sp. A21]|uniref:mycothiol synthase n=1 Tax=Corynebacterium sp. A21 TaxID=3457318 RepID=UPI003FD11656
MNIEMRELAENPALAEQLKAVAEAAARVDGVAPLSEQFLLGLADPRLGHRHLLALIDDQVVGLAGLDGAVAELVVSPEHRRQGIGSKLYNELQRQVPGVQVWAHGDLPGAQALAVKAELAVIRELLVMGIGEPELTAAAEYMTPEGFSVADLAQSRVRLGTDVVDRSWLDANNDAFSWHPEQGGWDLERLARAQEVDWFRETDVLFLWDEQGDEPMLAGFHWTKWHTEVDPAFGEVYVVGLAKNYRGRGLGGTILSLGLAHLRRRGAGRVILYVEADNHAAVKVYQNSGFDIVERHSVYSPK